MNSTTTTDPRLNLTPDELEQVRTLALRRFKKSLYRFTDDAMASIAPKALLRGMRHREYVALPEAERRKVIIDALERENALTTIANRGAAPAPAPAPVEEKPAVLARYFVSCARGCGRMLPVRSPRPVLKRCDKGCPA